MVSRTSLPGRFYRVWLVECEPWNPTTWRAIPPQARARETLDERLYSAAEARALIEGFNAAALRAGGCVWAIAARARLDMIEDLSAGALVDRGWLAEAARLRTSPARSPA